VAFGVVLLARSALPYTAVIGVDTQNDGNDVNDRAIIDGHVTARNAFRQPSFFDLDLRLVKGFRLSTSGRLDLIAELFNATARAQQELRADAVSNFGTPQAPVATAGSRCSRRPRLATAGRGSFSSARVSSSEVR
jgi:hypothetical protein